MKQLFIYCDGGASGNPGPAAIGVVIKDEKGQILKEFGKKIGETTNNLAEYQAVIEALGWLNQNRDFISPSSDLSFSFFLDSRLVVNQLNGLFKVKNAKIRDLILKIRELEAETGHQVFYQLIPRAKNWQADKLVNESLDAHVMFGISPKPSLQN